MNTLIPHRPGPTRLFYSKDGQYLFTAGADCVVRRFKLDSNEEPLTLDPLCEDNITGLAVSNTHIVSCSEDASVSIFDIKGGDSEKICRSTLPCRDVCISPDGEWIAVASDETKVRIVNVADMTKVMMLTATLAKSIKHVAFHPSGNIVTAIDTNGAIRIYSLSTENPSIIETISNVVPIVSADADVSCKIAWHPDGASFAAPTASREIAVYDRIDWKRQVVFKDDGHLGAITDIQWSPNGAFLASCAQDNAIIIWQTSSQKPVRRLKLDLYAQRLAWHPNKNTLSWTTNQGELVTQENIVPTSLPSSFSRPIQPSPIVQQESAKPNGHKEDDLTEDLEDAGAEWIEDDDGAGYIPNLDYRKRPAVDDQEEHSKRQKLFHAQIHEPIQPGSTPWRGQRRYLALNMVGWIWTVEQDDHNTVTVEFHDRDAHRQYHFTDPSHFSMATLDDNGALFAARVRTTEGVQLPASIHFRPHDSWAAYSNWTASLPPGEDVLAITISNISVVVCTNLYIRMYTLHGVPRRIIHSKSNPIVSAISYGNYAMIVSNGPMRHDGAADLVYTIYHTHRDETVQSNDLVPLVSPLKSLFFDELSHPFIYSDDGVLSVLKNWKSQGQAQWIPVLDTKLMKRRIGKDESYWPIGVMGGKFHCIILKGAERHPYFPRPIMSDFDFLVPITKPDYTENSLATLETSLVQDSILSSLAIEIDDEPEEAKLEAQIDRNILLLLNLACRNEQDARALDLCEMLRRTASLDAAVKLAGYHNRINLAERIGRIELDSIA